MLVAQFGSRVAQGWKPVWLASLAEQRTESSLSARTAWNELAWTDFGVDGYGSARAPLAIGSVSVSGLLFCGHRQSAEEWERQVRRYVGLKDWLIGFRSIGCRCGACGPYLRCCQVCGSELSVRWYARRARLQSVTVEHEAANQPRGSLGTVPVRMTFEADTPWQRMNPSQWVWGVIADLEVVPQDACEPPEVIEMHWPCVFPPCKTEPPYRFFRRRAADWTEVYCVGFWSAGRWIRAAIGSEAIIHVDGDTWPLSKLGFTNFSRLTVTVCSPTGEQYSFSVDQPVGEPQYLLVAPYTAPQIRYCPIQDDECLDLVPGQHAAIAQEGAPVPIASQTTNVLGRLWPGRNIIRFDGFRLPGHPFHFSYDIVEQFL